MSRVLTYLKEYPEFSSGNPKLNSGRRSHSRMNICNTWVILNKSFNQEFVRVKLTTSIITTTSDMQKKPPETFYVKRCQLETLQNSQENTCASTKFTGKHLYHSLFFNKVAGLRPQFCEISKNIFFVEDLWATASRCVINVQLNANS